ncbi:MAG TPA: hypothetical protein VLW50_02040 [Streptosporangiaceae bacterium]|nr:hypothetical protein [Streptosporangiaceae bacterium]
MPDYRRANEVGAFWPPRLVVTPAMAPAARQPFWSVAVITRPAVWLGPAVFATACALLEVAHHGLGTLAIGFLIPRRT